MDGNAAVPIDTDRDHDAGAGPPDARVAFLASATVAEEMRPLLLPGVRCEVLDSGFRINPNSLKAARKDAVAPLATRADTIVVGLKSDSRALAVPRAEPSTGNPTQGWVAVAGSPFGAHEPCVKGWGRGQAGWMMEQMLGNYPRPALINTGDRDLDRYRAYVRTDAQRFRLCCEETPASTALIDVMIYGPWAGNCLIA